MIYIPKGSIMKWNGNLITEHNRSEIAIGVERIETANRMENATLRKYVVADKRSFSCSWDNLPAVTAQTVDGKWGGIDIELFYNTTPGVFTLTVVNTSGEDTYNVVFSDFDKKITRRVGTSDFWSLSVALEEV